MTIGTKSLLYGYHQFLLHPLGLALCWWRLFGFPWDPRLWVAFFVHDLGYFGKRNMDGKEGEEHPFLGANIMHALFDRRGDDWWYNFTLYHSRFLAQRHGVETSKLCAADKALIFFMPVWLQVLMTSATGEINEYMRGQGERTAANGMTKRDWVIAMKAKIAQWFAENYPELNLVADPEDVLNRAEGRDAGIFAKCFALLVMAAISPGLIWAAIKWQFGLLGWWLTHTTICSACKKVLRRPVLPFVKPTHLNTSGGYCTECLEDLKRRYGAPPYTAEEAYLQVFKEDGI